MIRHRAPAISQIGSSGSAGKGGHLLQPFEVQHNCERVGDIVFMEGLCTKLFMTLFPIKNQNHPFHGLVTVNSGLQLGTVKDGGSVGK